MNEGNKTYVKDHAPAGPNFWTKGGAAGEDVLVGYGKLGQTLNGTKTSFNIASLDPDNTTYQWNDASELWNILSFSVAGLPTNGGNLSHSIIGPTSGDTIIFGVDDKLQLRLSTSIIHTSNVLPNTDPLNIVVAVWNEGGSNSIWRVYVNGELDSETTGGASLGAFPRPSNLLGLNGSGGNDAKFYTFNSWTDFDISPDQIRQLHRDPFGPYRQARPLSIFIPAETEPVSEIIIEASVQLLPAITQLASAVQKLIATGSNILPPVTQQGAITAGETTGTGDQLLQAITQQGASYSVEVPYNMKKGC